VINLNEEGPIDEGGPREDTGQGDWSEQQPPQQQPPQQQQPQRQVQRPPRRGFLEGLTSNDGLAKVITIGFVLLLVGMLIIHAAPFATNYDGDDIYGDEDDDEDIGLTPREQQDDEAFENAMEYTGQIIRDIGIFLVGLFLVLGGIYRDDLDNKYRMVMVSVAILFILVAWFGFLTAIPVAPV